MTLELSKSHHNGKPEAVSFESGANAGNYLHNDD